LSTFEKELGIDIFAELKREYDDAFTLAIHQDVRAGIVKDGIRPDGRKLTEIRPLSSEVGIYLGLTVQAYLRGA